MLRITRNGYVIKSSYHYIFNCHNGIFFIFYFFKFTIYESFTSSLGIFSIGIFFVNPVLINTIKDAYASVSIHYIDLHIPLRFPKPLSLHPISHSQWSNLKKSKTPSLKLPNPDLWTMTTIRRTTPTQVRLSNFFLGLPSCLPPFVPSLSNPFLRRLLPLHQFPHSIRFPVRDHIRTGSRSA